MKVFVTKYALTIGIEEVELNEPPATEDDYVYSGGHGVGSEQYRMGRTAFIARDDAVKAAETMRLNKIASLKKSIAKLQRLSFFRLKEG